MQIPLHIHIWVIKYTDSHFPAWFCIKKCPLLLQRANNPRYHLYLYLQKSSANTSQSSDNVDDTWKSTLRWNLIHRYPANPPGYPQFHPVQSSGSKATFHSHCLEYSSSRWNILSVRVLNVLLFLTTFLLCYLLWYIFHNNQDGGICQGILIKLILI